MYNQRQQKQKICHGREKEGAKRFTTCTSSHLCLCKKGREWNPTTLMTKAKCRLMTASYELLGRNQRILASCYKDSSTTTKKGEKLHCLRQPSRLPGLLPGGTLCCCVVCFYYCLLELSLPLRALFSQVAKQLVASDNGSCPLEHILLDNACTPRV